MNKCSTYESSLETEIGLLKISCCTKGVHSIHICENEDIHPANLNKIFEPVGGPQCLTDTLQWLKRYFEGQMFEKSPEVCEMVMSSKGAFTQLVWKTLKEDVPAGNAITYGSLAEMCGRSKGAARAVGTAMRTNPIPLVIPCHRVIKEGGDLGRYSGRGGVLTKQWLLRHEELARSALRLVISAQRAALDVLGAEYAAQMAELNVLQAEIEVQRAELEVRRAEFEVRRAEHNAQQHQRASGA